MGCVHPRLCLATVLLWSVGLSGAGLAQEASSPTPAEVVATTRLLRGDGSPMTAEDGLRLGEQVVLEIQASGPADTTFFVPSNPALLPFHFLGPAAPPARTEADARVSEVHRLLVLPLRVGAKAIDPIEIPYRTADGTAGSVSTDRLRIRIGGRLDNEQDPALAKGPEPVSVIATNWWLVWGLSLLGGALLATLITLLVLRLLRDRLDAARPGPPPLPADQVALAALLRLEGAPMEPAERYAAACDVLRLYLGGRYDFDGLEFTTAEMMASLVDADLKTVESHEVRALLDEADLVKFARLVPGDPEARRLIDQVRRIVLATWEAPADKEEAEEALDVPEPATSADRLKAAFVDVLLATAVGLVVLGGLWAAAMEAWAWLALLVAGLLLMVRDITGRSPGKAWVGLEITRIGSRDRVIPVRSRLSRNLPLLIPPLGLPAELLVMFAHPLGHRLGDLWAGTDVVQARSRGSQ